MWNWIDRIDSRFGIEKFKSGGIILRSRYFIPLVLILLPPIGLIVGALLAQPLSEWFPQSGITDNYEIAGVCGYKEFSHKLCWRKCKTKSIFDGIMTKCFGSYQES